MYDGRDEIPPPGRIRIPKESPKTPNRRLASPHREPLLTESRLGKFLRVLNFSQ